MTTLKAFHIAFFFLFQDWTACTVLGIPINLCGWSSYIKIIHNLIHCISVELVFGTLNARCKIARNLKRAAISIWLQWFFLIIRIQGWIYINRPYTISTTIVARASPKRTIQLLLEWIASFPSSAIISGLNPKLSPRVCMLSSTETLFS